MPEDPTLIVVKKALRTGNRSAGKMAYLERNLDSGHLRGCKGGKERREDAHGG